MDGKSLQVAYHRDAGEIYYPAFILRCVDVETTKDDVSQFLQKHLGVDYPSKFGKGRAMITVIKKPNTNRTASVTVEGIHFSWSYLESKLGGRYLRKRPIFYMDPYLGMEITPEGKFVGGSLAVKQNQHLCQTRGDLPAINIFRKDFTLKYLGGTPVLSSTIYFEDSKRYVNCQELNSSIAFNDRFGPGEADKRIREGKINTLWIKYPYAMQAFAELCRLNKNKIFSVQQKSFGWMKEETLPNGRKKEVFVRCEVELEEGVEDIGMPVADLLRLYGYIPKGYLSPDVFDLSVVDHLESLSECPYCGRRIKIVGVAANFGWFAAEHNCPVQDVSLSWPGEQFIRLSVAENVVGSLMNFRLPGDAFMVYPVIEGVSSAYSNASEFKRTALSAEKLESVNDRREMMLSHYRHGVITQLEFIEEVQIKGKIANCFLAEVRVSISKFWSEASQGTIGWMGLKKVDADEDPYMRYSLHELNLDNIKTKMFELVDAGDFCRVICHVYLPRTENLLVGQHVIVIPKPITSVLKKMEKIVKQWETYDLQRRKGPIRPIFGTVVSIQDCNKKRFQQQSFDVSIKCNDPALVVEECADLLNKCYMGINATLKTTIKGKLRLTRSNGRIYKIYKASDGSAYISAIFLLYEGIAIRRRESCSMEWYSFVDMVKRPPAVTLLPAGLEDVSDDEEEDYIDDELEENDDDEKEDNEGYLKRKPDFPIPEWIMVGVREVANPKNNMNLDISSVNAILANWMPAPFVKRYETFDYFLEEGREVKHQTIPRVQRPRLDCQYEIKRDELFTVLKQAQRQAVYNLLESPISVTQGPPGTGKTTTAVAGIFVHQFEEASPVVAVAPSNYACEVLTNKIKRFNGTLSAPLSVIRIVAPSKEEKLSEEIEFDATMLHHRVRLDPDFESEEMLPIITIIRERGFQYLNTEQRKDYKDHVFKIQLKYLRNADVIVCTVAVAGDGRLEALCMGLDKTDNGIGLLLIDEASLMSSPHVVLPAVLCPAKVALFGDGLQLSPVVKSVSAGYAGLGISWMDLLELRPFIKQNGLFTMLNVQFRMHPQIGTLVSEMTYQGLVKTDDSVKTRTTINLEGMSRVTKEFSDSKRVAFVRYSDQAKEYRPQGSFSYANMHEIRIIAKMLNDVKDGGVDLSRVAVICMYNSQVAEMQNYFSRAEVNLGDVEVSTVDGFQGREAEVVFVSCVRCNKGGTIGHLSIQKRLNVALSRAMEYLVAVGDEKTIRQSEVPFWIKFLDFVKDYGVRIYYSI